MVELLADAAPYSALLTLTVAPQTVRNTLKPTSTWLCRLFRVCFQMAEDLHFLMSL